MSKAEILLLAALAFAAGFLGADAESARERQEAIEIATTATVMPADFAPDPKGGAPLAIPDPYALHVPCTITREGVPKIRKSIA